jgi:hypothetical protein
VTRNSILYQPSGSVEVAIGAELTPIMAGRGMFIATGKSVSLKGTGAEPSTSLVFELVSPAGLSIPADGTPSNVKEIYRTAQPIAGLKPGAHDFNMTRVTFPAGMPSHPPHHQ